jgi:hypothetical protein
VRVSSACIPRHHNRELTITLPAALIVTWPATPSMNLFSKRGPRQVEQSMLPSFMWTTADLCVFALCIVFSANNELPAGPAPTRGDFRPGGVR